MKHVKQVNPLLLIALACTVLAQGRVSYGAVPTPQDNGQPSAYSVSVSAGQEQSGASANLTLSGSNSRVSVDKPGTVTLVAGKSIILRPGTHISEGGFLYASIEPATKPGKMHKKLVKVVTIEEKKRIDEQVTLSVAYTLFSPFHTRTRGWLHAGSQEQGDFTASSFSSYAVPPDQQRKSGIDTRPALLAVVYPVMIMGNDPSVPEGFRPETRRVLRL